MIGLRENIIDFEVFPTANPKTLVFVDSSSYISQPDSPRIQIQFPGFNTFFFAPVIPRQVNTFNSNTLGYTDFLNGDGPLDLPDGVYTIRYEICPYQSLYAVKNICRTQLIESQLRFVYEKIEASDCSRRHDKKILASLAEIHMLITGCQYIANSDPRKATEFYALADRMLRRLIKDLEKCCK